MPLNLTDSDRGDQPESSPPLTRSSSLAGNSHTRHRFGRPRRVGFLALVSITPPHQRDRVRIHPLPKAGLVAERGLRRCLGAPCEASRDSPPTPTAEYSSDVRGLGDPARPRTPRPC